MLYFMQTPTVAPCRLKSKLKTASEGAVVAGVSDKSSQWLSILPTHRSTLTLAPAASSLTLTRPLQRQISCKSTTEHSLCILPASSCKMTWIFYRLKKDDDDQKQSLHLAPSEFSIDCWEQTEIWLLLWHAAQPKGHILFHKVVVIGLIPSPVSPEKKYLGNGLLWLGK